MFSYLTQYGELKSISTYSSYPDDRLKDCVVHEKAELVTSVGTLIPQYEHTGVRRKHIYSLSFFQSGKLSRIALNRQTEVSTPVGRLPAELITFHESGGIKRLFPLNGQLSGYWNEDDEYSLAEELDLDLPFGSLKTKIIGICFYESGAVRSLTLWPNDKFLLKTPLGEKKIRIGFSLYPGGNIQSFEPAEPIAVMTPIGLIEAFDPVANGLSGDSNSISFTEDGRIKSLATASTGITVLEHHNAFKAYSPVYFREMEDHEIYFRPLKIEFEKGRVRFNGKDEYGIEENRFVLAPYHRPGPHDCSDCSSCLQCSSGLL